MNPVPPVVSRLVKGSLVIFPLLTILFWLGTPLGFWGAAYLALLLELLPALSVAQLPLVDDDGPLPRIPAEHRPEPPLGPSPALDKAPKGL